MRLSELMEIPEADRKDIARLEKLRRLNSSSSLKNDDIYRLLYRPGLYHVAYQKLKSKPGNMTPGSDSETLDGYSQKLIIRTISQLQDESYQPKPVRASYIPKANGRCES